MERFINNIKILNSKEEVKLIITLGNSGDLWCVVMESYVVQGKEVQVDSSKEYLVPSNLYDRARDPYLRARGGMSFAPLPIAEFLRGLDGGLAGPLNQAVSIYLEHCREALEFVRSTQDTSETQQWVEEGLVIPPSSSGNTKILEGLENTIQVLEQLQR